MASKILHIRKIERRGPYRLKLWFDNGMAGERDFSELAHRAGSMTQPFADPEFFDRVFLEAGALTWPNGYDWSPEALYRDMEAEGALSDEGVVA